MRFVYPNRGHLHGILCLKPIIAVNRSGVFFAKTNILSIFICLGNHLFKYCNYTIIEMKFDFSKNSLKED